MENNNQKIIVFDGGKDPNDIIEKILKNNSLEETIDDYFDKKDQKKEPWTDTLYRSSKNLASNNLTEENFILTIQKQLNISEQIAKNILKEIKEKLLPLARTLSKDEIEQEANFEMPIKPIERPIGVTETLSQTKKIITKKNTPTNSAPPMRETPSENKKQIKKIEIPVIQKKFVQQPRRQSDTYREPIE